MKKLKFIVQVLNKDQNRLIIIIAIICIGSNMLSTIFDLLKFNEVGILTLTVGRLLTSLCALIYAIRGLLNVIKFDNLQGCE